MCGEKQAADWVLAMPVGSPPRVRGKEVFDAQEATLKGITPACAGKRLVAASARGGIEDHPRVCGEKGQVQTQPSAQLGSPPRVRGKADFRISSERQTGITPACAGKSALLLMI